jgi:hypothetical protein
MENTPSIIDALMPVLIFAIPFAGVGIAVWFKSTARQFLKGAINFEEFALICESNGFSLPKSAPIRKKQYIPARDAAKFRKQLEGRTEAAKKVVFEVYLARWFCELTKYDSEEALI